MIDGQQAAGIEVLSVGQATVAESQNTIAEEDLAKGEGIGVLAAMVVLVIVFGALVAAGIPMVLAIFAIIVAFGLTAALSRAMDLSFFITNMITMIGLAVGVD